MKKLNLLLLSFFTAAVIQAQTEVTFYTTEGNFVVEIYDNVVPITGGNFLKLADQKFYDGVIFHRVIFNFMIQGGDPSGTGTGGPGYTIQDEFDSSLSNVQKTISMANSGPNTGGSQFFINLVDNTFLDFDKAPTSSKHPVFGMVTANFNVVQTIGKVSTDASDRPITDVVMDSIRRGNGLTVGINRIKTSGISMRIYPNPIDVSSTLSIKSKLSSEAEIIIYDALGKVQSIHNIRLNRGVNNFPVSSLLDISKSKGVYHIRIESNEGADFINMLVL